MSFVVGVCTYQRRDQLLELITALRAQLAEPSLAHSGQIVVVDNDPAGSGLAALEQANELSDGVVRCVVEPTPGITAARNRVLVEAAEADFLLCIDDDELPTPRWAARLIHLAEATPADAVAGPVRSTFTPDAHPWVVGGGFFDRAHRIGLATGTTIPEAATNNLLLRIATVRRQNLRFRSDLGFSGGEDSAFTRAFTDAGATMVWCSEAEVTEVVPTDRAQPNWVLRRAMSMGNSRALTGTNTLSITARGRLAAGGFARVGGGLTKATRGLMTRSTRDQGRGLRTAFTGVGMILGASGFSYHEYARDGRRLRRA